MTKELGDVLVAAEAATARGLPAFDHTVMTRGATRGAKRRRAVRASGTGALAVLVAAVLGVGGYAAYDHFGTVDPITPPIPSASDGAKPSPEATTGVTVGEGLPSAEPVTANVLDAVDTGWVLAIFDSTQRANTADPIQGERVLYLISPTGDRYEAANLTDYGSPYVAAWDMERQVALIVEGRYLAATVDLATGEVTHEWQFCGEGGSMRAEDRPGAEWLLRGFCSGEVLDGIYSDDFTFKTDEGVVKGGEGITVMNVGTTQVRYEFEMPPEQSYVAYLEDGTEVALKPVGDTVGCYPMGPALDGGLAVQCWGEGTDVSLWSLDLTGGPATEIASSDTLFDLAAQSLIPLPLEGAALTGYVLAGDYQVVTTTHPVAVILQEPQPLILMDDPLVGTSCYGGVGSTVLVQGSGALWTVDGATGEVVTLLPIEETRGDTMWVGAAEGGAIIHP